LTKQPKRKDKSGRCVRFITLHKPTLRALRLMETPLCDWPWPSNLNMRFIFFGV